MDYKIDETVKLIKMLLEMNQFQLSRTVDVNRKTFSLRVREGAVLRRKRSILFFFDFFRFFFLD